MNSLIWVRFWELSQNIFGILQWNLLFNFAKMEKTAWECNESHRKWGEVHQEKKICKHSWARLGWQLCQSVPSSTKKVEIKGSGFTDPCVCGIPKTQSPTYAPKSAAYVQFQVQNAVSDFFLLCSVSRWLKNMCDIWYLPEIHKWRSCFKYQVLRCLQYDFAVGLVFYSIW